MQGNDMINLDRTTATRRAPIDSLRKTALIAGVIYLITKESLTVGGPGNGHLTTAQQLGEVVEPLSDPPGDGGGCLHVGNAILDPPDRENCQPMTLGPAFVGVTRIKQRRCLIMAAR